MVMRINLVHAFVLPLHAFQAVGRLMRQQPMSKLVQAAFRGQAQKWHPDHVDDPARKAEASKQFRLILESYTVLRDPEKRRQYDRGIY